MYAMFFQAPSFNQNLCPWGSRLPSNVDGFCIYRHWYGQSVWRHRLFVTTIKTIQSRPLLEFTRSLLPCL
jgi:hypothetical protein